MGGSITTRFGNDAAVAHARGSDTGGYPAGAVLARVTWSEQADREWFGARIPGAPRSIEVVRFSAGGGGKVEAAYESFEGTSARRTTPADASVVGPLIQAVAGAPLSR